MAAIQADVRSDEWYTQTRYIEAARAVLGGIDLDPASSALANETVKAERYYTKLQNGLALPWSGRIWLNPPFGRKNAPPTGFGGGKSIMGLFVEKLVEEYELGNVTSAVALVTSKTDARWFQFLSPYPLCFANHRVLFNRPGRPREGHFYGTVFAYLGPDIDLFTQVFSQFGSVYQRVAPAKLVLPPIDQVASFLGSHTPAEPMPEPKEEYTQTKWRNLMYGDFHPPFKEGPQS